MRTVKASVVGQQRGSLIPFPLREEPEAFSFLKNIMTVAISFAVWISSTFKI
jgi:hypothetical protein